MTTFKQYDNLKQLTEIQSGTGFQPVRFHYQYNAAGQRTRRYESEGNYSRYDYDTLVQVKSGKKYFADGTPVPGQQFEYAYDDIGNRNSEGGAGFQPASYTANLLNQCTRRTVPGVADIIGAADPNTNVMVNSQAAYRKGEYFQATVSASNSNNAVFPLI